MNFLGIEIGGSKLQLATGNEMGEISHLIRRNVSRADGAAAIRDALQSHVEEFQSKFEWQAVGIGFGGPVNWKTGRISRSHQIDGWANFPLAEWLGNLTGLTVRVENDSSLAAYAESRLGAARGNNPVFYTNSGSGVGGGFVMDKQIFHGAVPGQMEFGHMRLDRKGTEIEQRCSGWAVDQLIQTRISCRPNSILAARVAETKGPPAAALSASLEENCPEARQILEEVSEEIAWGLSHVIHLLHPEVIVLGGGLALLGEPWRSAIARKIPNFIMSDFQPGPQIKLSRFQEKAVPIGALLLASNHHAEPKTDFHPSTQPQTTHMNSWIQNYLKNYTGVVTSLSDQKIETLVRIFDNAWENDRQIFVVGNGGSAANASHFATDLGKGSSDKLGRRFRVSSLNDNTSWLTALGNDYAFEDIFARQLMNYARPGDLLYVMSVSGNSPNLVKAVQWANDHGLESIALVGKNRGRLAEIATHVVAIDDNHYGRVEDAHMTIGHIICYAFMEGAVKRNGEMATAECR